MTPEEADADLLRLAELRHGTHRPTDDASACLLSRRLDQYRFGGSVGVEGAGALCPTASLVKILSPFSSRYIATTIVPSSSAPGRITDPGGVS